MALNYGDLICNSDCEKLYIVGSSNHIEWGTIQSQPASLLEIRGSDGTNKLTVDECDTKIKVNDELISMKELIGTIRELEARVLELEARLDPEFE